MRQDQVKFFLFVLLKLGESPARCTHLFGLMGKQAISSVIQSSSLNYSFRPRVLVVCDICGGVIDCFFSLPHPDSKVKCKNTLRCSMTRNQNGIRNTLALPFVFLEHGGSASTEKKKKKKEVALIQDISKAG